jgi:hypothetical protein
MKKAGIVKAAGKMAMKRIRRHMTRGVDGKKASGKRY